MKEPVVGAHVAGTGVPLKTTDAANATVGAVVVKVPLMCPEEGVAVWQVTQVHDVENASSCDITPVAVMLWRPEAGLTLAAPPVVWHLTHPLDGPIVRFHAGVCLFAWQYTVPQVAYPLSRQFRLLSEVMIAAPECTYATEVPYVASIVPALFQTNFTRPFWCACVVPLSTWHSLHA